MVNYSIFTQALSKIPQHKQVLINTINQYSYCIAEKDPSFKKALQESDILLPDGIAIVAAIRLLTGEKIKKIAGGDLHEYLLKDLNNKGGSCFYLGASASTLIKIRERMAIEYPSVKVGSYSPPFANQFTEIENAQMLNKVNEFHPDILFIGMTAPKQEKWAYEHRAHLDAKIICSIGAVFDFYAGTIERPGKIWINYGLEWFVRLIHEPKRLWKRYLYYGPIFLWHIIRNKVKHQNLSSTKREGNKFTSTIQPLQREMEY